MATAPSLRLQFLGAPVADSRRSPRQLAAGPASPRSPRCSVAYAPPSAAAGPSLYDVLGIPAGASAPEIKAAYRRLARTCHPDVAEGEGEEFIRVHQAYSTLSDPDRRADYDRRLISSLGRQRWAGGPASGPFSPSASPSAAAGFARRTWETDQCW